MTLSADERRALAIIASTGPRGATEGVLLTQGFTDKMLASLVLAGLVTVETETVRAGGPTTKVERIRITDAGRAGSRARRQRRMRRYCRARAIRPRCSGVRGKQSVPKIRQSNGEIILPAESHETSVALGTFELP
jgi:hypothetical protein